MRRERRPERWPSQERSEGVRRTVVRASRGRASTDLELVITCALGLEELLGQELVALGYRARPQTKGAQLLSGASQRRHRIQRRSIRDGVRESRTRRQRQREESRTHSRCAGQA